VTDVNPDAYRTLYPFQGRFLDIGGHRLHTLDEGDGPPVLMVHGNPTWSFYYRAVVLALRDRFRCIVPDHVGCGLSDKPADGDYDYTLARRVADLEVLLDRLGVREKLTIVLHDWGGMIGMALAARRPERIARIVVMNTAAFLLPPGKNLPLRLWAVHGRNPFAELLVRGLNLFAWGATWMATAKGLPREVRRGLTAPYNSWRNRIATLRFVQDIPLRRGDRAYDLVQQTADRLHLLADRPMLICWGMRDFVFDTAFLAEWRRRFPDADVHTFADAGHYVLEDARDEVIARVEAFLGGRSD